MHPHRAIGMFLALGLACACCAASATEPPLPAFTAHYRVLQNGSPIGKATMTLQPDSDGTWTFTTVSQGTAGLASLLGASTRETSRFRWVGNLPQGISYDYTMKTALKQQQRHVRFDWTRHVIDVEDHGTFHFATEPGALERHTVPLAIAAALEAGQTRFGLAVAVRNRIEHQQYAGQSGHAVTVPAGTFDAIRVTRTDGGEAFEAWFAPTKLPAPIRIERRGKNVFSLELESWSPQP